MPFVFLALGKSKQNQIFCFVELTDIVGGHKQTGSKKGK